MSNINDRVNLVYENNENQNVELPLKVLVLSDLTCDELSANASESKIYKVENNVDSLMAGFNLDFRVNIESVLYSEQDQPPLEINISLSSLDDLNPENLLQSIPELNAAYLFYRQLGDESISKDALLPHAETFGISIPNNWAFTDRLIAQEILFDRINQQLNLILQCPSFKQIESSWRSLDYLSHYINPKENMELLVCNISKQALSEDFEDSPDVTQSILYSHVYSAEFGQFGGRPYTLMVGDYEFGPKQQDINLLSSLGQLSEMSHCPLLTAASSQLFGVDNYREFSNLRDIASHFEQPQYMKWNALREKSFSRYICLAMPKFQIRPPYSIENSGFKFIEDESLSSGVWANAAFALATRFIYSFEHFRWFINVSGNEYGVISEVGMRDTKNQLGQLIPTEVLISDRIGNDLVNNGFTPLTIFRRTGKAGFNAVPSCHRLNPEQMDGQDLLSQTLESQIPYMLICSRFSQYIKVMQRENIGSWLTRSQIDQSVNQWLKQYVSDMDNPAPAVRARRPLRNASVKVRDVEGKSGWFMSTITITPHFKYMGKAFTLQERGRLEKA